MTLYVSIEDMARALDTSPETFRKFWGVCQPQLTTSPIPSSNTARTMRGHSVEETISFLRMCTPITDAQEAVLRSLARKSIRK